MQENTKAAKGPKFALTIDLRFVCAVLLAVIVGMFFVWKPWSSIKSSDRTVTVSGTATITAEPDEYTFQPSYEFKNANKNTALAELTAKSEEIVKKLKDLGVASSKIKTNADGYTYSNYYFDKDSNQYIYSLHPNIRVGDKALAQKVQDYLITTSPSGLVTPQAGFSETMQKELESKGRDEATRDARTKADQSAKNLGFKIYKVKSVDDGTSSGGVMPMPYAAIDSATSTGEIRTSSLPVQPGEDKIVYTVTVTYYIR